MVLAILDDYEKRYEIKYGKNVNVLVASRDIQELEIITKEMLELKSIPEKFVQPFDNPNSTNRLNEKSVVGNVASIPILKGEQISTNKLSSVGARTGLSRQITPGKRAFAVPVNQQTGVSKMIKPGDRVIRSKAASIFFNSSYSRSMSLQSKSRITP
jgi:Flp pilus assembly protein CpaB